VLAISRIYIYIYIYIHIYIYIYIYILVQEGTCSNLISHRAGTVHREEIDAGAGDFALQFKRLERVGFDPPSELRGHTQNGHAYLLRGGGGGVIYGLGLRIMIIVI